MLYCACRTLTEIVTQDHLASKSASSARERPTRDAVPTELHCSNLYDSIWAFTSRFGQEDRNKARILIGELLTDMQTQIKSMQTKHVERSELRRHFSRSDVLRRVVNEK